jgi:hypothetical protein
VLNPDLVALDVDVQSAAVNPMLTMPADAHQLIMPGFGKEDLFDFDIAVSGPVRAVLPEDLLD